MNKTLSNLEFNLVIRMCSPTFQKCLPLCLPRSHFHPFTCQKQGKTRAEASSLVTKNPYYSFWKLLCFNTNTAILYFSNVNTNNVFFHKKIRFSLITLLYYWFLLKCKQLEIWLEKSFLKKSSWKKARNKNTAKIYILAFQETPLIMSPFILILSNLPCLTEKQHQYAPCHDLL